MVDVGNIGRVETMKKVNDRTTNNRNRLHHQILYNDNNGLISITSTASHAQTRSWFYTWLGYHTQQFQMRISIQVPIAITAYSMSLCFFPPRI